MRADIFRLHFVYNSFTDMYKKRIQELTSSLDLKTHPEGGFYKETYRSKGTISESSLEDRFDGERNYCTGIYFLLTSDTFSAFHRIKQDEMWHFYEGSSLTIHMIDEEGKYSYQRLGLDIENGENPQFTVPENVWFAAAVNKEEAYTLVGCTVSPGFDFKDFELAERSKLIESYPDHRKLIEEFTRQ